MKDANKQVLLRVIRYRMKTFSQTFDDIIKDYHKLSKSEIDELRSIIARKN